MNTTPKRQGRVAQAKSEIVRRLPRACQDEQAAVEFLEEQRWGKEPYCPHCGVVGKSYAMIDRKTGARSKRFLWRCRACGQQFTVRVGTVFEDSRIPLKHWVHGFWRASASKKGVSALQISRETGLSYKSALFLMHRIRWAMTGSAGPAPLSGTVEADETYVGGKRRGMGVKKGRENKVPVVAMVERKGRVRAMPVAKVNAKNLGRTLRENIAKGSRLMTDEGPSYPGIARRLGSPHETVNHSHDEYVRGDAYTNTVEGFFSLLKRGIVGTFHSVSKEHLHRYVTEFEFRYNHRKIEDGERTRLAIQGASGKRLRYK